MSTCKPAGGLFDHIQWRYREVRVSGWGPDAHTNINTHTHTHKRELDKGENAWGNTWHYNKCVSQSGQVVSVHRKGSKNGWVAGDRGWSWRGRRMGGCDLGGLSLSGLPSWRTKRPRQSHLLYPTLPTPLLPVPAGMMSQASWGCHVHTPIPSVCPLSPLSQLGFNHWRPTVAGDRQQSTYQTQIERQPGKSVKHKSLKLCNI